MVAAPPRWNLSNVYPNLDSPKLAQDIQWVKDTTEAIKSFYQEELVNVDESSSLETINLAIS